MSPYFTSWAADGRDNLAAGCYFAISWCCTLPIVAQ